MHLLEGATEPQREAITHVEGPLLVLAGAGSGKTLAITRRIAYLIECGVPPGSILAITFTNKAAGEMRERVEKLTGIEGIWISTFHSLGSRLLRRHAESIGFTRDFTIYDTVDQVDCVKEALRALEVDTTQWKPAMVASRISHSKNLMIPKEELEAGDFLDRLVARVRDRYAKILRDNNALDFDDLLLHVLTLFRREPALLERYRERFSFVLVDEYQDTNRPQYLLAKTLAEKHGNLCVTGDPDQSIYRWRGADIDNILNFERDFPGARVVRLEENFRSTGHILEAASAVISHNVKRKRKSLWTRGPEGDAVRVVTVIDESQEARWVARAIVAEVRDGRSPSDIAIFFRTNALSRSVEAALILESIPYTIVGSVEFFRRREIKDLLAYLRIRDNPADSASVERVINVPRRGIGAKTLANLKRRASERGVPLIEALRSARSGEEPGLTKAARNGIADFLRVHEELSSAPDSPVGDLVRTAIRETGYDTYVGQVDADRGEERLENLDQLVAAADEFDRANKTGTLRDFLEGVALLSETDKWERDEPRVTLMTMHAAKGLEFPVVFIVGLEEGILPHKRSIEQDDDVEEERRLFHVGMTRAMERLVLLHARERAVFGRPDVMVPSRFLDEIPAEAREDENLAPSSTSYFDAGVDAYDLGPETGAVTETGGTPGSDLQEGDTVQHQYFGIGTVLSTSGEGSQLRAVIRFESGDERKLLVEYAKLARLD